MVSGRARVYVFHHQNMLPPWLDVSWVKQEACQFCVVAEKSPSRTLGRNLAWWAKHWTRSPANSILALVLTSLIYKMKMITVFAQAPHRGAAKTGDLLDVKDIWKHLKCYMNVQKGCFYVFTVSLGIPSWNWITLSPVPSSLICAISVFKQIHILIYASPFSQEMRDVTLPLGI